MLLLLSILLTPGFLSLSLARAHCVVDEMAWAGGCMDFGVLFSRGEEMRVDCEPGLLAG